MSVYLGKLPIGIIVSVIDEHSLNVAYVKQMDLFSDINGDVVISNADYSDEEMQRLEEILINLTEGDNG